MTERLANPAEGTFVAWKRQCRKTKLYLILHLYLSPLPNLSKLTKSYKIHQNSAPKIVKNFHDSQNASSKKQTHPKDYFLFQRVKSILINLCDSQKNILKLPQPNFTINKPSLLIFCALGFESQIKFIINATRWNDWNSDWNTLESLITGSRM